MSRTRTLANVLNDSRDQWRQEPFNKLQADLDWNNQLRQHFAEGSRINPRKK